MRNLNPLFDVNVSLDDILEAFDQETLDEISAELHEDWERRQIDQMSTNIRREH